MISSKKALIVTTVSGFVPQFELNNVRLLQNLGYEVHYAANYKTPIYGSDNSRLERTGIVQHQVDFVRSPYRVLSNIKAYRQLKKVLNEDTYQIIHCHTPMGAVICRMACRKHNKNTVKVIYTAHGFHFYDGAPLHNWLLYYPIEYFLARYTDVLVTINEEDFQRGKKFPVEKCYRIPGTGFVYDRFKQDLFDRTELRRALDIPVEAIVFITIGELNRNKNQQAAIKALSKAKKECYYVLCGMGPCQDKLMELAKKLKIEKNVRFLGFRDDIPRILHACDCYLMLSKREGLGIASLEAMAAGLPIIALDNRGAREYVRDKKNGIMCRNIDEITLAVDYFLENRELLQSYGYESQKIAKLFDQNEADRIMKEIYSSLFAEELIV